jgi:hypothetical protein
LGNFNGDIEGTSSPKKSSCLDGEAKGFFFAGLEGSDPGGVWILTCLLNTPLVVTLSIQVTRCIFGIIFLLWCLTIESDFKA